MIQWLKNILFSWMISAAHAQEPDDFLNKVHRIGNSIGYTTARNSQEAQERFGDLVGTIIQSFLIILGVVFFILMFSAGWIWMNAKGDEEKVRKAKEIIKTSIVGILIVALAFAVTKIVSLLIQGSGLFQ